MKTLELKDIAGYLPYDLYAVTDRTGGVHLVYCARKEKLYIENYEARGINIEFCKAILRPLSDLYKPIIHNGKEIIPIVECAKIFMPNRNWRLYFGNAVYGDSIFGFNDRGFFFEYDDVCKNVDNQYQLFDFLHELKIDYRGLIDAGVAVSVYDLENNPYK
jgi:hypothetical protein